MLLDERQSGLELFVASLGTTLRPQQKTLPAEFLHVKPGKGAAFVRSKIKNLKTGNTVEKTFRAGEAIELADVYKKSCQYTYSEVCP